MDVTPLIPSGRQLIEAYGGGRFRITGIIYEFPIVVSRLRTVAWPVADVSELALAGVLAAFGDVPDFDILLVGCGPRMTLVAQAIRAEFRARGIVIEPMDTGAACRTYNVLLAEDRRVAAALIPV